MYLKTFTSKSFLLKPRILYTAVRTKALEWSPNAKLNKGVLDKFMCLPIPECVCQLEYVWVDGTGQNVRSQSRNFNFPIASHKEAPTWSCDGSQCYFKKDSKDADIFLCPVAMYKDPMRRGKARIVLCDTYQHDHKPTVSNARSCCLQTVNACCDAEILIGFHQQYFFLDVDDRPYGWPQMLGYPKPPGGYYAGVGASRAYCRDIVEAHYRACLYAGVAYGGTRAHKNLSQWEFKIQAVEAIKAADDLWMARYLLIRIAEEFGVKVSFNPQFVPDYKGSCCHITFSTKDMRKDDGIKNIEKAIGKLCKKHEEHVAIFYPKPKYAKKELTFGVEDRKFNIRIPRYVSEKKKGWFQDRRPKGHIDPYKIVDALISTIVKGS